MCFLQVAGTEGELGESWWIVEIVDEVKYSGHMWAANYSHVRLRSNITGHYLVQTGGVKLKFLFLMTSLD